ncbi:cotton fiber protein [Citrus sinensis]|uniref:Cotton fiber protein n=1 Tax=Citrus sinensis TaxID=2711 RepID=A0ACB8NB81_CITSI|nr:cotton fiber protein [Citrus sinensis]KAH9795129.1 cotton fiber protein [Citrus sinensis]
MFVTLENFKSAQVECSNLRGNSVVGTKGNRPHPFSSLALWLSTTNQPFIDLFLTFKFLEEYQFSASSTPLIRYRRRKLNKNRCFQDICSMFFLCTCFGGFKVQGAEAAAVHNNSPPCSLALETLPAAVTGEVFEEPLDLVEDEDDSVDQRAEKFIEWFYQEMRLQRQDSI